MYRGASISTHTLFLLFPLFQIISELPGENQQNDKQCCLWPLSFKISISDTSFHISLKSLGLYLSPEWMLISNLYIPSCERKIFKFMVFAFPENALNLGIITNAPVPHSTLQTKLFENLFSQQQRGLCKTMKKVGKNYDIRGLGKTALSKSNQKIKRWLGTLGYLYFAWFVTFFKCNEFTVL